MASGRLIGDAFIAILPETSAFRSQADAQIKRSLGTLNPKVKVGADTGEAQAQVAKLAALIKSQKFSDIDVGLNTRNAMMDAEGLLDALMALRERAEDIPVSTDDSKALSNILTMSAAAERLAEQLVDMKADADITPILAKYYALDAKTKQLQADMSHLDPDMNPDVAISKLAELRVGADQLNQRLMNLNVDANDSQALAKFAQMQVTISSIAKELQNMPMDADTLPIEAKMLGVQAAIDKLQHSMSNIGTVNTGGLSSVPLANAITQFEGMETRIAGVNDYLQRTGTIGSDSFNALTVAIHDTEGEMQRLQMSGINADNVEEVRALDAALKSLETDTGLTAADANQAARGFGILGRAIAAIKNTHIDLFGGALANTPLPNFLTQASGIHMLTEGVIELTAVWGPMLIGLSAFAALAYTTGKDVYTQFTNMNTVVEATGAKFKGLSGGVKSLEDAIQPQVMQLFGDYLTVAGNQGSHFRDVMVQIGTVLDNFGAKIAMDLNSQKTSSFLEHASSDLQGVGVAFGDLGRIIHTLMEAVPGYAEMLLKFGDGFLGLVANVTQAMEPVIAWFLKLHGAIFYLGLATTAVMTFGRSFAAAAIAKGAAGLSESFTGMAESANRWAEDFTSDNEKIAEAAGNSGSKLGTWAQGIGGLFGNLINSGIKLGSTFTSIFKILTGQASVSGLAGGIGGLETAIKNLGSSGKLTTEGLDGLQVALTGLKGASTDAAGIQVLNDAIMSLKDTGESTAAVEALQDVLGGMRGGGGIATDAEDAGQGVGKFSQVLSKLPGLGLDAEGGVTLFGGALAALPLVPVAAGVAVLAGAVGIGLYLAFHKTADSAEVLQASLQKMVASSNLADVQENIGKAITETGHAIQQETMQVQHLNAAFKASGGADLVSEQFEQSIDNATSSLKQNKAAFDGWVTSEETVSTRLGSLEHQYGGLSGAMNIMSLAGVNQNDVVKAGSAAWALDEQKINATAQAYGFMNQSAGTATAHLNTLTISTGNVTKATQTLVSAEQAWLTLITGGDTAFTGFEQGMVSLESSLKGVKGGLSGTSAGALTARAAFDQQITAAGTLYGNLQQLAAASGNTGKAQGEVAQSAKDMVAQLIPQAKSSKEATAELYAFAQVAGYTGKDSLASLAKWAGTAKGAEADLDNQQAKLTISSANLTQAAKNLGNAIINEVTQMEAAKVASGSLESAVNGLFNNFKNAKGTVNQAAVSLSGEYVNALEKAGSSQQNATQMLNAYLKTLGYTPGQIKEIDSQLGDSTSAWNTYTKAQQANATAAKNSATATKNNAAAFANLDSILPGGVAQLNDVWAALVKQDQAMVTSGKDSTGTKNEFIDFAHNGLNITTNAANELWQKFGEQNLDSSAAKAANTKAAFLNMAENGLHIGTEQAQTLWGELAQQNLDMIVTKGDSAKTSFMNLAKGGLDLTTSEANTLWATLQKQYLDTLAGKAGETESAFEKTASQFGLNTKAAAALWSQLKTLAGGSPYNVGVNETLSGKGKITAAISATSVAISSGASSGVGADLINGSAQAVRAAGTLGKKAGGVIHGSGPAGQDSVPALLAPGELVVPTGHAAKFGAQAKAAGIPGFAAGTLVGGAPTAGSNAQQGVPTMENAAIQFTQEAMSNFASQVNGQFQQDSTAAMGGPDGGPLGPAGAGEIQNGESIFKYLIANAKMTPIAAAGAIASIWGESTWNPMAQGTGGRGLIGWTPPSTISNAAFSGGLSTQLPMVIKFISTSGDWGVISEMNQATSVLAAANLWGKGVERYGINDVHAEGITLATSILNGYKAGNNSTSGTQAAANAIGKAGQVKPHSTGGVINEPVYGYGANSGMAYSFAENGQPEYVSNGGQMAAGASAGMPGATSYQMSTLIGLIQTMVKQNQQMPQAMGQALSQSAGSGVHHGFFGAQN
jgi:hypothetical protein